jgi:hypothetical protein
VADKLKDFLELPTVQGAIRDATRRARRTWEASLGDTVVNHLQDNPVGSPIEAVFLVWWLAMVAALQGAGSYEVSLQGQHTVEFPDGRTYRLDFRVLPDDADEAWSGHQRGISFPPIGVELDGHDWHERTPEQVTGRNQRDRDLQGAGWRLFHFSGSELVRDPERCVLEVLEASEEALWEWRRRLGAMVRHDRTG